MQPTTVNLPRNIHAPIGDIETYVNKYDDPGAARQLADAWTRAYGTQITPFDLDYHVGALGNTDLATQINQFETNQGEKNLRISPNSQRLEEDFGRAAGSRVGATDIYNSALEQLGISDARTRVTKLREALMNTENLFQNVEGDISGRTQNALVSEGQRRRLVAQEQEPIAATLDTLGENFEAATGDYGTILNEGARYAELGTQDQNTYMDAILERLQLAAEREGRTEDARRYEIERQRLDQASQLDREKFERSKLESDREFALASKKGSASGGKSGGGGGSSKLSQEDAGNEFLSYIAGKFNEAGGAGAHKASRQAQDSWANAWFASKGVTDPEARQYYWDLFNSQYKRPGDPYSDWLYAK